MNQDVSVVSMTAARPVQPPKPDAAVLREGLGIVWSGMRQEKRMITIAVIGAALWAAATVATSMAIGYITENIITPAATSGMSPGRRCGASSVCWAPSWWRTP
ncbi:hypothetical protein [Ornithinimicrobium sp. INDO-MA30-4]|uniref:hypothetical protein n=1 Tax=Ornithinimicrobium sp. INDO-MA30-4 TaxID=2908651 RepID=UPI001F2711F5|nr:hypothetical protein [Ornithinimicrobium sp. INDO-MA30-4]UJH71015.1 hypothetical protein L0A91_03535 [Ornithinimicrobium sp. INDO-MA30-4]